MTLTEMQRTKKKMKKTTMQTHKINNIDIRK